MNPSPIVVPLGKQGKLSITIKRLKNNPIIKPGMDSRMGKNINGPSLIRVPNWVKNPLGNYYLYFANHKGNYIKLAYADQVEGPWTVHEPGSLSLQQSHFLTEPPPVPQRMERHRERMSKPRAPNIPSVWDDITVPHIASPDVLVVDELKEIRMYYHGLDKFAGQFTRVAISKDGLNFTAQKELIVERSYLRVFPYQNEYYAMAMPGVFFRSKDELGDFEDDP